MADSFHSSEPIESLFGNLHSVIPLLIALAAWIVASWKKMRPKRPGETAPGPEASTLTQRVQEEVRRKIAARRAPLPTLDPFGGPQRRYAPAPPPFVEPPRAAPIRPDYDEQAQAVLAQQGRLAAQVRALDQAAVNVKSWLVMPEAAPGAVSPWLAELRDPASFRRAFILREVLGAPVALR